MNILSASCDLLFLICSVVLLTYLYTLAMKYGNSSLVLGMKNKVKSKKFCETALYFLFYVLSTLWGMLVLYFESWPLQTKFFWIDYPRHSLSHFFKYYYIFQFAFYLHQSIVLTLLDGKRKDYIELGIHHMVTLGLISISYILRHFRIGLVILVIHDLSDVFLNLAKCFHYVEMKALTDITFGVFAFVFFVTRLVLFPKVAYSIWWEPQLYHTDISLYSLQLYFWKLALLILQILHIFWFSTITRMIVDSIILGGVKKDARSDSDEDER